MSIEGGLTKIYTHETFENSLMDFSFPLAYPIVKWAGGKTQLLRKLTEHMPAGFNRYFEPFLGGGALFFYLSSVREPRFTAYLSDINQELISMYEVVKSNVEDLIDILRVYAKEYEKSPVKFYYNLRDRIDRNATSIEKAARTITLNRTCYNGLYRVNRNGEFNVPIGRYKKPVICDSTNLRNASLVLRSLESHLYSGDYQKMLAGNAEKGDFIYLDPPYNPTTSTANFTGYTHAGFTERDQERLANTFSELDMRGCKVLLSNSDTEYVKELYIDHAKNIHQVNVRRSINSKTSKRIGYTELLIRNYSK